MLRYFMNRTGQSLQGFEVPNGIVRYMKLKMPETWQYLVIGERNVVSVRGVVVKVWKVEIVWFWRECEGLGRWRKGGQVKTEGKARVLTPKLPVCLGKVLLSSFLVDRSRGKARRKQSTSNQTTLPPFSAHLSQLHFLHRAVYSSSSRASGKASNIIEISELAQLRGVSPQVLYNM